MPDILFLGANPELVAVENGEQTSVLIAGYDSIEPLPIYEWLKNQLAPQKIANVSNLPSFIGGAVGYFDFSAVEYFEPVLKTTPKDFELNSQSQFGLYRTTVAFDHARQQIVVITVFFGFECPDKRQLKDKIHAAKQKNAELYQLLETADIPKISNTDSPISPEMTSNWKKDDFKKAVSTIKELINAGECYQVVLSQCFSKQTNASPESIYRALRSLNPSPYMILMKHGEKSIVGASPRNACSLSR